MGMFLSPVVGRSRDPTGRYGSPDSIVLMCNVTIFYLFYHVKNCCRDGGVMTPPYSSLMQSYTDNYTHTADTYRTL